MKKARNVKVGSVVEVPDTHIMPARRGWEGWTFKKGIVREIGNSQRFGRCYKVEFPTTDYVYDKITKTKIFIADHVFAADLKWSYHLIQFPREHWSSKTYGDDTEFLIDNGIIEEPKF